MLLQSLSTSMLVKLRAHLNVLRVNTAVTLILMMHLLLKLNTVKFNVEIMTRLRDLSRLQLANERKMKIR